MKYSDVPTHEHWRTFLTELLSDTLEIPWFTDDELEKMVSYFMYILTAMLWGHFFLLGDQVFSPPDGTILYLY